MVDVKKELEKLLQTLVTETTKEDASFSQKLDTFKELRAYYALTLKTQGKSDDDEDSEEFSFANGIGETHGAAATGIRRRGNS